MDSDLRPSSSPRKVRFAPKGPPRREVKPPQAKSEAAEEGDADVEMSETLLRKVNDHLTRRHPKAQKKFVPVLVLKSHNIKFDSSFVTKKPASVQVAFSHGVASSTSIRTYGVRKDGTGEITNGKGLKSSTSGDGQDLLSLPSADPADEILENSENDKDPLFKKKKREYKEPWDYHHSYYPTTLPLRKPFSGDPELLDEGEFGQAASAVEYDESTVNSASDLGLLEKVDATKMFFFQLPANIPFGEHPTSTDRMEAAGSIKLPGTDSPAKSKDKVIVGSSTPRGIVTAPSPKGKEVPGHISMVSASKEGKRIADSAMPFTRGNASKKVCSLEELPAGCMGKMLVYKSGAVKLKLGDILYDVSPGSDCAFAQEIMTVNRDEKQCCALELEKRAIVTPDIDSLLDPVIHLE